MIRSSVAIVLSFVIFWTSSGFTLEHHYCSKKDEHSYTIAGIHHSICESEQEESSSCCSVMKQKELSTKRCCTDTKVSAKLDVKAVSQRTIIPDVFSIPVILTQPFVYLPSTYIQLLRTNELYSPPDIFTGSSDLILLNCTLLI